MKSTPLVAMSIALFVTFESYCSPQDAQLPVLLTAKIVKEDPKDDELRKLQKLRYNEALTEVKTTYHLWLHGKASGDRVVDCGPRLMRAGLEVVDGQAEKVSLLTQYVALTTYIEKIMQTKESSGLGEPADISRARYERLDAEIQLLRAKREA